MLCFVLVLEWLQHSLICRFTGTISKAVQPAVHDVTDASAMRSWFNVPLSSSLESDIYKATNIVRMFARVGNNAPERNIPSHILKGAAGFAILSTVKVSLDTFLHAMNLALSITQASNNLTVVAGRCIHLIW